MTTDPLFTATHLGALSLKHRMAPLTRLRSRQPGDVPNARNAEYYGQRADDGGLIISAPPTFRPPARDYLWRACCLLRTADHCFSVGDQRSSSIASAIRSGNRTPRIDHAASGARCGTSVLTGFRSPKVQKRERLRQQAMRRATGHVYRPFRRSRTPYDRRGVRGAPPHSAGARRDTSGSNQ